MSETVIFPEMIAAGIEAISESRDRGFEDAETAVAVYLAMRAVEEMFLMREGQQTRH